MGNILEAIVGIALLLALFGAFLGFVWVIIRFTWEGVLIVWRDVRWNRQHPEAKRPYFGGEVKDPTKGWADF